MNDRAVRILDILSNNKSIKVTMLAELLDVSQVTLRRDLDFLEKQGIINRTHGFASLDGADETSKRMAFSYSIKRKIAVAAAKSIEEDETVMIESGSCCALFAEELALNRKNITIITNSIFIANYICNLPKIKIILLGGYYQPGSQVLIGPMIIKYANEFFIDKLFLGTDGFIPGQGFTSGDYLRAETAAVLANCFKKVFVLTESAKFNRRGAYNLIQLNKVTGVYTDDNISKEAEDSLFNSNVLLVKVPAADEKLKWRQFPGQPPILYKEK